MKKILCFLFTTIFLINPTNASVTSKKVNDLKDQTLVTIGKNWNNFKLIKGKLEQASYYNYDANLDIEDNSNFITLSDSIDEAGSRLSFSKLKSDDLDDSDLIYLIASEAFHELFFREYNSKNIDYYDFDLASDLLIRPIADLLKNPNNYDVFIVDRNASARTHLVIISKVNNEALLLTNDFYKDQNLK